MHVPTKADQLRHLVIPDIQAKPGVALTHCGWAGEYIRAKRPEKIVLLGDLFDYPSLGVYDSAAKKADKGVNVAADYAAGVKALDALMKPWSSIRSYKPKLYFCGGNHEDRVNRHLAEYPFLRGSIDNPLDYVVRRGWSVCPYGTSIEVDGITYSHLFPRSSKGTITAHSQRMGAPSALAQVRNNMTSCTAGHKQGLDVAIYPGPSRRYRGVIAGSFYQHDESYLSGGQTYWRGILMKHRVKRGDYDLTEVSLDYLKVRYG